MRDAAAGLATLLRPLGAEVDIAAHSYGTAVAAALMRHGLHRRAVLLDPICFLEQASQMSLFTQLDPSDPRFRDTLGDSAMAYFIWYWIFRDLGLATVCARGLIGEEYMDIGAIHAQSAAGEVPAAASGGRHRDYPH